MRSGLEVDYRQVIIDSVIDQLEQLKTSNQFGIQIKTIGVSKQTGENIKVLQEADMLPAMFYGYGDASENPGIAQNNEIGKTLLFALHVYFDKDAGDTYLVNTVAKMEDAFATVIEIDMRDGINNDIEALGRSDEFQIINVRVSRSSALTLGLADIEARQILFAIDWVYEV